MSGRASRAETHKLLCGKCGEPMVRTRAASSPPSAARRAADAAAGASATAAAAEAAAEAAAFAHAAAEAAAEAAASTEASTSTSAVPWPPAPNQAGLRFWFVRGYPHLEDGIYTALALANNGVDPERPAAEGLLAGWKTADPVLRRARATGTDRTVVFWR